MYFLEKNIPTIKIIKNAQGIQNSNSVMPYHTNHWKQIAVCNYREPLEEIINNKTIENQRQYRIISNIIN